MDAPYAQIEFPASYDHRPYTFVNMVATLDGKTLSGSRDEHVMDLGSDVDHQALRNLELHADAVLIGAETVRATKNIWYPAHLWRIVATRSGNLPWHSRFFTDSPEKAIVLSDGESDLNAPSGVQVWQLKGVSPLSAALNRLRGMGVHRLVVEGGSELNASLIAEDLVDEFFLTVAPKIKLGRSVPTYAGGEPLGREKLIGLSLVSAECVGDEVFLRYKRRIS